LELSKLCPAEESYPAFDPSIQWARGAGKIRRSLGSQEIITVGQKSIFTTSFITTAAFK